MKISLPAIVLFTDENIAYTKVKLAQYINTFLLLNILLISQNFKPLEFFFSILIDFHNEKILITYKTSSTKLLHGKR